MHDLLQITEGQVTVPGFNVSGVHCDVRDKKDGRLDLALIVSERPCSVAGVFTENKLAAAPVRICREILNRGETVQALLINSGNANACTGSRGMRDTVRLQEAVAEMTGCHPQAVLVCSTGRIGEPLPMARMLSGVEAAAKSTSTKRSSWENAADAILTSDTRRKVISRTIDFEKGRVTLTGIAKGAGMIEPNMATMLAYIFTDAEIAGSELQRLLRQSVEASFNAITVDGDESTNDSVLSLANGTSGVRLSCDLPEYKAFAHEFSEICKGLAGMIVGDGEKITKVVEVCIEDAATKTDAQAAARAVGNSLLVKSSWYGGDPNWGRLMDAVGYSGALVEEECIRLWYASQDGERVPVFLKGEVASRNKPDWVRIVSAKQFRIFISLGKGDAGYRLLSTDLTEGYVNFNKSE